MKIILIKDLIQKYYDSLNKKDTAWQELWSEDSSFSDASQALNAQGKSAIIQSFTPFLRGVESVSVQQMIAEGENISVIAHYVYINQKGEKMDQDVAEIWKVSDDKLKTLTLYFDLTAYRAFIRA